VYFSDQLFSVDILAMGIDLIVILLHESLNIEVDLDLLLLDLSVDDIDERVLEEELSVHVETHLLGNLILKVALVGPL
jgi:hypothetical protein